ncbi:MAG: hypothetical protein K8S94_01185 [Planctomycetia bacterium]|nr:hypothetical protein [Planctomycetia bacterium]
MIPALASRRRDTVRVPYAGAILAAALVVSAGGVFGGDIDPLLGGAVAAVGRAEDAGIVLVGTDTPGDPGFTSESAADSPAESSGPFDVNRGDVGEDDDLGGTNGQGGKKRRRRLRPDEQSVADKFADPLEGTERIDPATTAPEAAAVKLAKLLPPRTDTAADWFAPLEPLHWCGEPRALPTCVPPPPCHPSLPPRPLDLVGIRGCPTCGPIYRGPCAPRTGSHDDGPLPHLHRVHDRLFDWFYNPRTPILP